MLNVDAGLGGYELRAEFPCDTPKRPELVVFDICGDIIYGT